MIFIAFYLSTGIIFIVLNYFLTKVPQEGKQESLSDILKRHARAARTPMQNRLHDLILTPLTFALGIAIALSIWPLFLYWIIKDKLFPPIETSEHTPFAISKNDLINQYTVEQIESHELVSDPLGGVPNLPFGHLNKAWTDFISEKSNDDSIWSFTTIWSSEFGLPDKYEGYVITNEGRIGKHFITGRQKIKKDTK